MTTFSVTDNNGEPLANDENTPVEEIKEQLKEMRPLPLGMTAFEEFFQRIWSGALLKSEPGKEEFLKHSIRVLLADEVVYLPGSQTHQHDLYFINRARKLCANQIALASKEKARLELQKLITTERNGQTAEESEKKLTVV